MIKSYGRIILPNRKINVLVIVLLLMGVIMGAIFANIIGLNDKTLVIDKIKLFINNINNNTLDSLIVFKNSITINFLYIGLTILLSLAIFGMLFNLLLLFIKSFIFGFSMASFILTYHYKGIILSFLYLMLGQLLNIIIIIILTIYGIMISNKLLKLIFKNNNQDIKKTFKNYLIIIAISIILSIISAVGEAFLLPASIKIIIKMFV